jgi:hypothetical protein
MLVGCIFDNMYNFFSNFFKTYKICFLSLFYNGGSTVVVSGWIGSIFFSWGTSAVRIAHEIT